MSEEKELRLLELLDGMDVPGARRLDLGWLMRNLAVRNEEHENFAEAMSLVRELAKLKTIQ